MLDRSELFRFGWVNGRILELILCVPVAVALGVLIFAAPYLPLSSDFQKIVLFIPVALTVVVLFDNLERLILFTLAIGVPLNIDISVIVSPYAANPQNIGRGLRTLIALTELRVSVVMIVLVIGYAVWFLKPWPLRAPVRYFRVTTVPALAFILISCLSVVQAEDKQLWMFRIAQLVEVFLVYFYLVNHIRTTADMRFFVAVSLIGLMAESLLMIVQWFTQLTFSFVGVEAMMLGPHRAGGTLGHTGPAAGYLSALVLIACAAGFGLPRGPQRTLAIVSLVLGVVALIATGSRIGWFGFAITLLAFLVSGIRLGWIKPRTLLILLVFMAVLGVAFSGALTDRFTLDDSSAQSRLMMWRLAWNMIKAQPWLGVGAGNYALETRAYYTVDVGLPAEVLDKIVHNAYLGVWAESGTFALLSLVIFLSVAVWQAWSCSPSHSPFISLLGVAIALGIVSLCIQMMTGTFHTRAITQFVWSMVALAAVLPVIDQPEFARLERVGVSSP